jgi:two-component system LytT family sensor kinase
MFRFKISTFIIHLSGWLLFLLLPVLFLNSAPQSKNLWLLLSSPFYWLFGLTYLILFYFNSWYLLPQFFLKKRYFFYALIVLILFGLVYFLQPFDKLLVYNPRFQAQMAAVAVQDSSKQLKQQKGFGLDTMTLPFGPLPYQDLRMQEPKPKRATPNPLWRHSEETDIVSLVLFLIITALALSVETVEQWHNTEQKIIKAESEKVNAELSFLKAQINPHFLFNTLNNIYSLSVINSEHTSESIMKLSNLMRYVADDVMQNFVPLRDEINSINDYVDLQKLRLGSKTLVDYQVTGTVANQTVPPLILMSFIENMFKYGISKKEISTIKIKIKAEKDRIEFCCENQIFNRQITDRSGIGIANTKQRLQHLYGEKHNLTIREENGLFKVDLVLHNF